MSSPVLRVRMEPKMYREKDHDHEEVGGEKYLSVGLTQYLARINGPSPVSI